MENSIRMETMADSPHWQTALLTLDWGDDLARLERWIAGPTFSPHWVEFERNWLGRCSELSKVPSLSRIIFGCLEAWESRTNEYYIKCPNATAWNEKDGLGHYIRLLTMIVWENMASNAIWPVVESKDVRRYFEKALVIVNCMREEWSRKGSLFTKFQQHEAMSKAHTMASNGTEAAANIGNGAMAANAHLAPNTSHGSQDDASSRKSVAENKHKLNVNGDGPKRPSEARPKSALGGSEISFLQSLDEELKKREIAAHEEVERARKNLAEAQRTPFPARRAASAEEGITPRKRTIDGVQESPNVAANTSNLLTSSKMPPTTRSHTDGDYRARSKDDRQQVAEDIERVLAKEPSSPSGTSRKRARLATESGTNGVSSKNPIIKSEEDMTSAGNIRELRPPPLQHSSTQRPAQTSDYRTPHPETSRYGGDVGLARQPPANLGSHAVTNGSKGGPKGPSYSRPKARRDYLEDVCAFELKGQPCQMPEGCFKKNVCVRYSKDKPCSDDCNDAHVYRSCRYKIKHGLCNKEAGLYPKPCTYGHEAIRLDMWKYPERYH